MDPNNSAPSGNQKENIRPMNEPHTPITMDEMNPNIHNEPPKSAKNTLLTLASLLVLVGIVGITLYLYIQNNTINKLTKNTNNSSSQEKDVNGLPISILNKPSKDIICARFTDLKAALQYKDQACDLDLSGQKLTSVPEEVYQLTKLNEINLSKNKITQFPKELLEIKSLVSIDLSNNEIGSISDDVKIPENIQKLLLSGNNLSKSELNKFEILPPTPTKE